MNRLRLTLPWAIAISVLAPSVVFSVLFAFRLTLPKQRLTSTEAEVERLTAEVSALAGFAKGESAGEWSNLLQKEEGAVAKRLPLGRHDAELVDALEGIGYQSNVSELSIRVEGGLLLEQDNATTARDWMLNPTAPEQAVHSFVINTTFRADYRQFLAFLSQVANLERFVAVDSLTIERAPPQAKVALTLRSYYQ